MTDDKKDPINGYPDLTQFIRSIQRIEGKPDCFARTATDCDNPACQWHSYCVKELKKKKEKAMSSKKHYLEIKPVCKDLSHAP
ncbi:MAG: hypothetical protein K8S13_15225 [Desulfobacula sp.]|uniref:hypothetical protein n=1 Tax=Desulfobacula sp. TaxID=2593537 RepID=UPI0025BC4E46|nr:hypothetical protein [Desulfobacula sp.]MCD4721190.1 hypothetical protein [Desulfobacula sp.]